MLKIVEYEVLILNMNNRICCKKFIENTIKRNKIFFISLIIIIFILFFVQKPIWAFFLDSNFLDGVFKKVKYDKNVFSSAGKAHKLKDGNILFILSKNIVIFDSKNKKFKEIGMNTSTLKFLFDEGFVLNDNRILFISPDLKISNEILPSESLMYEESMFAQLYDIDKNEFIKSGKINIRRTISQKVQLDENRVFIIGGIAPMDSDYYKRTSQIEFFDTKTEKFTLVKTDKIFHSIKNVSLLQNNKIIINYCNKEMRCDLYTVYDPIKNSFSEEKSLNNKIGKILPLRNGSLLLFTLGYIYQDKFINRGIFNNVKLYNPISDEIKDICYLVKDHGTTNFGAVELNDGQILVYGGSDSPTSVEIINLLTGEVKLPHKMNYPHYYDEAILLNDGSVLIGGNSSLNFELFIPYVERKD